MPVEPVTLAELATVGSGRVVGDASTLVSDVTHDSRAAGPSDLFVAIRGARRDGHDFVASTSAGAACVEAVVDAPIPQLVVEDTRAAISALSARVHGDPSTAVPVIGITGTNGKTTVAHMLAAIVEAAGGMPGVIGTIGARIGADHLELARTSPEASDFQRLLRRMVEAGVSAAAVEVSSHALTFGRTAATHFAAVAFTNLTQDHLDLHGDMESYFEVKASLFSDLRVPAIVNIDDPWGRVLAARHGSATTVGADGEYRAANVVTGLTSSRFDLVTPEGSRPVTLPLGGLFNISNALVAAACAATIGVPLDQVTEGLASVPGIPGRMEPVAVGRAAAVIVDYAHTPDGIEQVLESVRPAVTGRLIAVVGAGGDRDADKRPAMGRAVSQADIAFITSDNPRSEDPAAIIDAVVSGADGPARVVVEPDRRKAIAAAIAAGRPDDAVLILGKGHETGQEIDGRIVPFDDREVAREVAAS